MEPLPAQVVATLRRLGDAGLRALVVGGAVRDALLGRPVRDVDLLVEAGLERAREALPEAHWIPARWPVLLLEGSGHRIEVAGLRPGARTLEEDLSLRDFSVNAIALDPLGGALVDPTGGREDLAARRLRAPRPERSFRDDPVRVLRGVRQAFALELALEAETRRAMARDAWRLAGAPGERLRDELFRLLVLDRVADAVRELARVGALAAVLPELLRTRGITLGQEAPDDAFALALARAGHCPPRPRLRLAALLVDAARAETREVDAAGRSRFPRYELRAQGHVRRCAERLRLSSRDHAHIGALVRQHRLDPARLQADERAVRRLLARTRPEHLDDLLALRAADLRASASAGGAAAAWPAAEARVRESAAAGAGRARLCVSGRDVMRELGIRSGPEVGRWLRRLERRVVERPRENERARLLAWLREAR